MADAVHAPQFVGGSYDEIRTNFRWQVPERFNAGSACSDIQDADATALITEGSSGSVQRYRFREIADLSSRMVSVYDRLSLARGDRVAIMLPQSLNWLASMLGALKAGLVAMPLSSQLGVDSLRYRLADAGAAAVITDAEGVEKLTTVRDQLSELRSIVSVDGIAQEGVASFEAMLADARPSPTVSTLASDPALLIYTSGTTGPPKGVIHAHSVLIGQSPGVRLASDLAPQPGDVFWTPAEWAWAATAILCDLYLGETLVAAQRRGFDPEWALATMARHRVRVTFLTPTALRMLRPFPVPPDLRLRDIISGGEPMAPDLPTWCREKLGIAPTDCYGLTEADLLAGGCPSLWPSRPGTMGRPYPGHRLEVHDDNGIQCKPGDAGELALQLPNPAAMIGYWRQAEATQRKTRGGWLRSGDLVVADEDGYLWFQHRTDDLIKSAGYRIGPSEIEECLLRHPAVANCAVIGAPDPVRGQVVKACVLLHPGHMGSPELEEELRQSVKTRLASYQYPRIIEFVSELPMTTSGKVNRGELRRRAAETGAAAGDRG